MKRGKWILLIEDRVEGHSPLRRVKKKKRANTKRVVSSVKDNM